MLFKPSSVNWKWPINISITESGPETPFCSAGEERDSFKVIQAKRVKTGIHEMLLSKIE